MAFTCGFFNSDRGDRKYNAEQISAIFDGIIADGVFATIGDHMAVTPGTGMQVLVGTGKAWFDHTWNVNDSLYSLDIAKSDVTLDRIDAVVLETNHSDSVRFNGFKVIRGAMSSTPVKPTLTNTETIHQHPLAWVRVKAGATAITASMIENAVGKTECPFVTGVVEVTSIDDLFNQWNGEFDEWFANLKTQLSGDVAANLQRQIDENRDAIDKNGYRFEDSIVTYEDKFHTVELDTKFPTEIYKEVSTGRRYIYGNTLYIIGRSKMLGSSDHPELRTISFKLFGYDFETDNKVLDIDIGENLWAYVKSIHSDANILISTGTRDVSDGFTKEMISVVVTVMYRNTTSSSTVIKYYRIYLDLNTYEVNFVEQTSDPGSQRYICNNRSINMLGSYNKNQISIFDRTFNRTNYVQPSNIPGVGSDYYFALYSLDNDIIYAQLYSQSGSSSNLYYYSKDYGNTWTKINFPKQGQYSFLYNPIDELMYFLDSTWSSAFSFDGANMTQIDLGFPKPSSTTVALLFNNTTLTFFNKYGNSGAVYKLINSALIRIAEIEAPYAMSVYLSDHEFILEDGSPIYMDYTAGIVYRGVASTKRKVFKGSISYGISYENYTLGAETPIEIPWDTKLVTISIPNGAEVIYKMLPNLINGVPDLRYWPTSSAMVATASTQIPGIMGVVRGNSRWYQSGSSGSAHPDPVPVTIKYQHMLPDRILIGFDTDCSISLVRMIKKG